MMFSTNLKSDVIALLAYSLILHFVLMPQVYDLDYSSAILGEALVLSFYSIALLVLFQISI